MSESGTRNNVELIWYPCRDDIGMAEAFGVPGFRGYIPLLRSTNDNQPSPTEQNLLLGILYGWPNLVEGDAMGVPNDRNQNEKLRIPY